MRQLVTSSRLLKPQADKSPNLSGKMLTHHLNVPLSLRTDTNTTERHTLTATQQQWLKQLCLHSTGQSTSMSYWANVESRFHLYK